jgi:hypothetical protein
MLHHAITPTPLFAMSRKDWIPRSYPNRAGRERMFWWQRACPAQKPVEKQQFSD